MLPNLNSLIAKLPLLDSSSISRKMKSAIEPTLNREPDNLNSYPPIYNPTESLVQGEGASSQDPRLAVF